MVNIYYQYTEQVTEDMWRRCTRHITIDCPIVEDILKSGKDVVDAAVVLEIPQKFIKS
jgi:hypothetical protein